MKRLCNIQYYGKDIGTAQITREGLYYRFCCRCTFPKEGVYKLTAHCGGNQANLGICVPMESAFGLVTKIPVSRIGEGEITVSVETKNEKNVKVFPVSQAAPFPHIEDLDRAVLCLDGIQIKDRSQVPPDNDQTREHPQI